MKKKIKNHAFETSKSYHCIYVESNLDIATMS